MVLSLFRKKADVDSPTSQLVGASSASPRIDQVSDPMADRVLVSSENEFEYNDLIESAKDSVATNETELTAQVAARINRAKSIGMDQRKCLDAITFDKPVTQAKILDCLRTFGVAIFPSIYDPERLSKIAKEYVDLIESGDAFASNVAAREDTPANSYAISLQREKLDRERFPETTALFGSPTIKQIAERFFAGQDFDFNWDLFVQWTDHTEVPASGQLHWDKQLTLKSWLYVTDGTEDHGAMRAGAGTAAWLRYVREDAMFDGIPYNQIRNQVDETNLPVVSTGGPAGTFFLFVTDTAHGATPVAPGLRRNIMRSRSRPLRVKQWANWAAKL